MKKSSLKRDIRSLRRLGGFIGVIGGFRVRVGACRVLQAIMENQVEKKNGSQNGSLAYIVAIEIKAG